MATPDPLPAAVVESVADQLGRLLDAPAAVTRGTLNLAPDARPALAESLAVCNLSVDQVKNPDLDVDELARPSGFWHHQVRTGGRATHMASSVPAGFAEEGLEVSQWVESPIAGKIDDAIAWVDKNYPGDDATVRLLVAPAYLLHALLIVRGRKCDVVLVDQPEDRTRLKYGRRYTLRQFLAALAKETPSGNLG